MPRKKINRIRSDGKIYCSKCCKYRSKEDYNKGVAKRGRYVCKICLRKYRLDYKANINRVLINIYGHQKHTKYPVEYTWEEFSEWATSNRDFMDGYRLWLDMECHKSLIPAVIRIDCTKPFSLNNLKACTAKEARNINIQKRQRGVTQYSLDGVELSKYPNARIAAKIVGITNYSNIHLVCKGQRPYAKGYVWKYT